MSYSPVISGGIVVEVSREEYENLIRDSEMLAIIKRFAEANAYLNTSDIKTILNIKREGAEV